MKSMNGSHTTFGVMFSLLFSLAFGCAKDENKKQDSIGVTVDTTKANAGLISEGKHTFRYDTFGDEAFWGDALQLHNAIQGSAHDGIGDGVSPKTTLSVGLKVDMDALPASLVADIKAGKVNMEDVARKLALLKLNAIAGVTGIFNEKGNLKSMGVQCALCHSTVDDAFAPGIGHRLKGWANRDLNVGAIVGMAPNLEPFADMLKIDIATVKKISNSWGPGRYDTELNLDGKAFRPDGLFSHTKGGFYHDGRFANLLEVVDHYNTFGKLNLTKEQKMILSNI